MIRKIIGLIALVITSYSAFCAQTTSPQANKQCTSCHQQSTKEWQQSDHAKAMAEANSATVLADFNNKHVEHYGQKALFFIKDNTYQVTISYDDNVDTYPIKYTFGHFPLQQYLVETEQGKLQVLPFAWDSRSQTQGGQRWYHNYSHEEIRPEDRLHWRQPLQNWNGMCADCHSDGLVRNFDIEKNSFETHFDNINVSCISCHGEMPEHTLEKNTDKNSNKNTARNVAKSVTSTNHPTGQWLRSIGEKTAHWQGKTRDNAFMDNCFACHSLRSPLTDGIKANTPFLDQFTPSLLAAPMYHADGQIKEEVYVYGSFLQSKMYGAGVNCLDCHNKHTMKLKIEGNGLCLQCHGAEVYNVKTHHQHQEESTGAQCVNCHMPSNRYMGVDDRRDHSFKIPRPDLSAQFDTPNACIQCHDDKTNQWASDNLTKWHGKTAPLSPSKQALMALNSGYAINLEDHLALIADNKLDVISRATAIQLLSFTTNTLTVNVIAPYLTHEEPLLRLSAASIANLLTPNDKVQQLSPLLTDQYRSVRIAAARSLVGSDLATENQQAFNKAFNELIYSNKVSSWRGEGLANQAVLAFDLNDIPAAEKSFKKAIEVDPYFEVAYTNLAEIYRLTQQPAQESSILLKGINRLPKSAPMHYAYGLYFVRAKHINKAITFFKNAMELMPDNSQYAYTYLLALDGAEQTNEALSKLKVLIGNYQDKSNLKELGLYLAQKLKVRADYDWFMKIK